MYFIEFKERKRKFDNHKMCFTNECYIDSILGDRGVFILDGRNSLDTMINDAFEHISSMGARYKKEIVQFDICRGENMLRYSVLKTINVFEDTRGNIHLFN